MTLGPQFDKIHEFDKPIQLPLFMTGSEIISAVTDSTDVLSKDAAGFDAMWKRKTEESKREFTTKGIDSGHGSGTYDSLKEHGWNPDKNLVGRALQRGKPLYKQVTLHHMAKKNPDTGEYFTDIHIVDAHHRIAAAAELEREGKTVYIPVQHHDFGERFNQGNKEP